MNSNMTLTVLNLHQKTEPKMQQDFLGQGDYDKVKSRSCHEAAYLTNVPTKHQLPTPYSFRDKAQTNFFLPPAHPPARPPARQTMTVHTYTS